MSTAFALVTRRSSLWLVAGLVAGLALSAAIALPRNASAAGHVTGTETIVVSPNEVDLEPGNRSSGTVVWIYGSGFMPGEEVSLFVEDGNGVLSDVSAFSTVFPLEANQEGAFATQWTLGRFTRSGVGAEGMQSMWAFDAGFNAVASAPIAFCNLNNRDEGEAVPDWCSQ